MTNNPPTPLASLQNQFSRRLIPIATIIASCLIASLAGLMVFPAPTSAQPGPLEEEQQVSASIPDHTAPSVPILISPSNNAILNTATPTFVWQASSDDVAISHYAIYKDGSIWYDNLPTTNQETSNYTYSYDASTNYYSFTPKNLLDNGTYTWKVVATDTSGNWAESVTWTYTIDTKAPTFVVEQVGNQSVTISAQDPSTHPQDSIKLQANKPLLTGTGEAGSNVNVTITTPTQQQSASFTIDNNGTWQLQLGVLPRDVVIYLDFIITDQAGNVSVLQDVPLLLESAVVPIPPEVSPAPPGIIPGIPGPFPDFFPTEIRKGLLELIKPILPPMLVELVEQDLIQVPEAKPLPVLLLQFLALIVILTPPISRLLVLLSLFGRHLTVSALPFLAGLAGILPYKSKHTGVVFAAETGERVAFARVVYSGITHAGKRIYQQVLTNAQGFFQPPELTPGNYVASAIHPGYHFPTALPRENHLSTRNFYLGEQFAVTSKQVAQQLCIPVDLENLEAIPWRYSLVEQLKFGQLISWLSFILAAFITLLFPTTWNLLAVGLFILVIMVRLLRMLIQPRGTLMDSTGAPLDQAILRFSNPANGQTLSLSKTNRKGQYSYRQLPSLQTLQSNSSTASKQENQESFSPLVLVKHGWKLSKVAAKDKLVAEQT